MAANTGTTPNALTQFAPASSPSSPEAANIPPAAPTGAAGAAGAVPGPAGANATGAGVPSGGTGAAGAGAGAGVKAAAVGPRKVRLTVARLDPWSVLKFSFLISFAIGIMIIVASAVFWFILDGMHVFTSINDTIAEIAGDAEKFNILQWVTFERTMSLATIVALIDVVVLTVLSTVFSLLYNLTATLVGGVTVTLTDE